jgi:hypothetical protein
MKKSKKPVVNTRTMGVNMPKTLFADIERHAKAAKVSKSLFCKTVLSQVIESGECLKIK